MERVVVNRSFTLLKTFFEDGVAADPDAPPTVTITRSDGSAVTAGGVIDEAAAGTWSVTVPASENDLLDTLTVDWAATVNGVSQEHVDMVEVAGGVLFTIAEARALKPLDSVSQFSTAAITAMRTTVEEALEQACEVAFVPRYARETLDGTGAGTLLFRWPRVTAIRDVTVGGTTTLSSADLAGLTYNTSGIVGGYTWPAGYGNVTVGYEHGYPLPPAEVKRAGLILARMWLTGQNRPIDDRAITFNATEGGTYSLAVPGRNGSVFGHPDVDSVVQRYSLAVSVA